MGTANVLAHEIGIGRDMAAAARAVLQGRVLRTFPGVVNGRRFVMFAGAGFDAHVVENVRLGLKRISGKFAYLWEFARSAVRYPFQPLQVEVDGKAREAYSVVVCNGARYSGNHVLAARARLGKKGFQVCLFHRRGFVNVLRYGLGLLLGRVHTLRDVEILEGFRVRILGPDRVAVQADGEPAGRLPAEITVSEEPLDIIVP